MVRIASNKQKNTARMTKEYGSPSSIFTDFNDQDFDCWELDIPDYKIEKLIKDGFLGRMMDEYTEPITGLYYIIKDCKITELINEHVAVPTPRVATEQKEELPGVTIEVATAIAEIIVSKDTTKNFDDTYANVLSKIACKVQNRFNIKALLIFIEHDMDIISAIPKLHGYGNDAVVIIAKAKIQNGYFDCDGYEHDFNIVNKTGYPFIKHISWISAKRLDKSVNTYVLEDNTPLFLVTTDNSKSTFVNTSGNDGLLRDINNILNAPSMSEGALKYVNSQLHESISVASSNYNEVLKNIMSTEQKLISYFDEKERYAAHIESLKGRLKDSISTDEFFKDLFINKEIESISFDGNTLTAETKILLAMHPVTRVWHIAGKFVIRVTNTERPMFVNKFGKIAGNYAFHVDGNGTPCLGNIAQDVSELQSKKNMVDLLPLLIMFLKSALITDSWGAAMWHYPIYPYQNITTEQHKKYKDKDVHVALARTDGLWTILTTEKFIELYSLQEPNMERNAPLQDIWAFRKDKVNICSQ